MTTVIVSGHPRPGSRTRQLAVEVGSRLDPAPVLVDVAQADAVDVSLVAGASFLVVATPTYLASYTGALKLLLDQLEADGLAGVPAVTVVTAGSPGHGERAQAHLREVLEQLGARVIGPGLVVTGADQDRPAAVAASYVERIRAVAR